MSSFASVFKSIMVFFAFSYMIRDIQLTFPDNKKGEDMKKRRLLEAIKKFVDRLQERGFISGYRLRESGNTALDSGLNGYEGIEIFSNSST